MPRTTILRRLVESTRPAPITTLRRQVARATVRAVTCCALLAAPVVGAYALPGNDFGVGTMDYAAPEHGAVAIDDAEREQSVAERIVERHDCWTGDAPADMVGVVPGAVVMTLAGQGPRYFAADHRVGQALDHLFATDDPAVAVVHGFCR